MNKIVEIKATISINDDKKEVNEKELKDFISYRFRLSPNLCIVTFKKYMDMEIEVISSNLDIK